MQVIEVVQTGVDAEARCFTKGGNSVFGYKQHAAVDNNGLTLTVKTTANCHDSKPLLDLLDKANIQPGIRIHADKTYSSQKHCDALKSRDIKNGIQDKATKNSPLTRRQLQRNRMITKVRYGVERTLDSQTRLFNAKILRYCGLAKAHTWHILLAMAYNLKSKIIALFCKDLLSIKEIQRRTSLSRNTIKKWLKAPNDSAVKYQRVKQPGKLTAFESRFLLALEADFRRSRKNHRTAKLLFEEIRKDGYVGGYTIVCDFIRDWRTQGGQSKTAFVPLKFALGEAFQFDWSGEWLVIGGIHRKMLASHTKLCASRAFMLSGYSSQSHEMLFDAHTRAFAAFGGVPKRGIYDNMKTAVDKVSKGNGNALPVRS